MLDEMQAYEQSPRTLDSVGVRRRCSLEKAVENFAVTGESSTYVLSAMMGVFMLSAAVSP